MENIPSNIHGSWYPHIGHLFKDPRMEYIRDVLTMDDSKYLPEREKIFRVFEQPIDNIKVVIIAQDPYPRKGQPTGLAFAVNPNIPMPASLRMIDLELLKEGIESESESRQDWRTLEHWEKQGIFLINTALTVKINKPATHTKEWKWFTSEVVRILGEVQKPIFVLWGNYAKQFVKDAQVRDCTVLIAPHPAAEAYTPGAGFIGCGHFIKINEILASQGKQKINF